jgi:hypothetical protein
MVPLILTWVMVHQRKISAVEREVQRVSYDEISLDISSITAPGRFYTFHRAGCA